MKALYIAFVLAAAALGSAFAKTSSLFDYVTQMMDKSKGGGTPLTALVHPNHADPLMYVDRTLDIVVFIEDGSDIYVAFPSSSWAGVSYCNGRYAMSYATEAAYGSTQVKWNAIRKNKDLSDKMKGVYLLKRSNDSATEDELCVTPGGSVQYSVRFAELTGKVPKR